MPKKVIFGLWGLFCTKCFMGKSLFTEKMKNKLLKTFQKKNLNFQILLKSAQRSLKILKYHLKLRGYSKK
jgi:hypothetical protein